MERFLGYRYGAFIHWNPATLTGKEVSWSRGTQTPYEEYDQLYKSFDPIEFDAEAWVTALKEGGFRYLVFVPKHHDGFAMWDTKTTDYNIMQTPFGRDVVGEIAAACKKLDLPLCMYYSIIDFYQPDCVGGNLLRGKPRGGLAGYSLPAGQEPDLERYVSYMKAQLKELTENYGPFVGWWFDGNWLGGWTYERGLDLYNYMQQLQPGVLTTNRVGTSFNGEVYLLSTWHPDKERRVGDYNSAEMGLPRFSRELPWEYTQAGSNGHTYSWSPGGWGGPYMRTDAYGSTCRDNTVYLHMFNSDLSTLVLPALPHKVVGVSMLNGGHAEVNQTDDAVTVTINPHDFQHPTTIVTLELDGSAEALAPIGETPLNRNVPVRSSNEDPSTDRLASNGDMSTYWESDGKTESPWLEYDLGSEKSISRAVLFEDANEGQSARIHHLQIEIKTDDGWTVVSDIVSTLPLGSKTSEFSRWPISIANPEIHFDPVTARHVRLKLSGVWGVPVIHEFELYER